MDDEPKGVEELISAAVARGEFDDLPGTGRPLDLDEYFRAPEDLRMGYSILKGGGFVPEEVQLLKDVEALAEELKTCRDERRKSEIDRAMRDKRLAYSLKTELARRAKG